MVRPVLKKGNIRRELVKQRCRKVSNRWRLHQAEGRSRWASELGKLAIGN